MCKLFIFHIVVGINTFTVYRGVLQLYEQHNGFLIRRNWVHSRFFFWWVCVALRFIFLCCIVLFCFVGLHPVSCVPKDASASGLSILDFHFGFLYSIYCRVKLLLFAIEYFILLQTQPSNRLKIVFHNCCCVVPNTKRTPFGIKLLIAIFG